MYCIWITKKILVETENELSVKFLNKREVRSGDDFSPIEILTNSDYIYRLLQDKLSKS